MNSAQTYAKWTQRDKKYHKNDLSTQIDHEKTKQQQKIDTKYGKKLPQRYSEWPQTGTTESRGNK